MLEPSFLRILNMSFIWHKPLVTEKGNFPVKWLHRLDNGLYYPNVALIKGDYEKIRYFSDVGISEEGDILINVPLIERLYFRVHSDRTVSNTAYSVLSEAEKAHSVGTLEFISHDGSVVDVVLHKRKK